MKRYLFLLISFSLVTMSSFAQFETNETPTTASNKTNNPVKKRNTPISEKLVVGGGFDLRFGDVTALGLTPLVGYAVTDNFIAGGIFTYRYFKDNRINYTTSTYGIAPFARYFIFKGLFAHAEYEMLNGEFYINQGNVWVNSALVGAGYGSRIGNIGFLGFYALWNLTEKTGYEIYNQPTFRVNFGIGL